eukprot:7305056-Pyramimonas_sp.AAC.1
MSRDYGDTRRYKLCRRCREICIRLMRSRCPIAPVMSPWIATILLFYPLPDEISLLCACMCDAFACAHNRICLGLSDQAEDIFEARLRVLTR